MGNPHENERSTGNEGGGGSLRIDRWLWCTRLFKSRPLAAEAVAGGTVHVNGQRVKPAHGIRVGDRLEISRPGYSFECEILRLLDRRGAAPVAQACYLETDAARAAREKYTEQSRLAAKFAQPHSLEKPDKRGRRELRRLRGRD